VFFAAQPDAHAWALRSADMNARVHRLTGKDLNRVKPTDTLPDGTTATSNLGDDESEVTFAGIPASTFVFVLVCEQVAHH